MTLLAQFAAPHVERHLVVSEGEVIVDEVRRHWVSFLVPVAGVIGGGLLFFLMPRFQTIYWLPLIVGLVLGTWGFFQIHAQFMDRFVITNMRVFRVHGVINQQLATVPISRILDITVRQPLLGRLLGYGHFVFESAAQVQGLKDIHFVPEVERRNLTIQRVIQRAGLRSAAEVAADGL